MIVRMRHLDLVTLASDQTASLEALRALGAVHIASAPTKGAETLKAEAEMAAAEKAVKLILAARGKETNLEVRPHPIEEVFALAADREKLETAAESLEREIKRYAPYGDFDPVLAQKLLDSGYDLTYLKVRLPTVLPPMRLGRMREKLSRIQHRIALDTVRLAETDEQAILKRYPALNDRLIFVAAQEAIQAKGPLAILSGWIPVDRTEGFVKAAQANGWAYLMREPRADETPPTLIEPPKAFRPMKELFKMLGISPAYSESDVSVPFMCYFSLFFAMLVGDGAYGMIFLAATLYGWMKYRRASVKSPILKSWLVLLTVFSSATVIWGLLSNTWFGAQIPFCANWPTVKWLADPSYGNMMLLCFTIGASHLILARLLNGLAKINDSTAIAEFGWAGIVLFMYFVTNNIVGVFSSIPTWAFVVFGVSLVAVFGFTVKPSQFKSRGGELGMLPLNIMSALGDIISYVRLFAVGLASVKVAENFNSMATGLMSGADSPTLKAVMAVLMVLVLVLGHGLNLAMAALSILVHAVRLNTLEFSNHKGVSWSGYLFRPFRKESN